MIARRFHQIEDVGPHLGGDEDIVHRPGQVGQHGEPADHGEVLGTRPHAAGGQQVILGLAPRIPDAGAQQEPVTLAEGQGVGARCVVGILGGDHHERLGQRMGDPVDAHLPLFHGFEQGRLRLGRGPVQFVRQQDVGEDRSGMEDRGHPLAIEDHGADEVGGQQVGRELHPAAVQAERLRQRLGQRGLSDPRQILNEEMAPGGQAGEGEAHNVTLAEEHRSDVGRHLPELARQETCGIERPLFPGRRHRPHPMGRTGTAKSRAAFCDRNVNARCRRRPDAGASARRLLPCRERSWWTPPRFGRAGTSGCCSSAS